MYERSAQRRHPRRAQRLPRNRQRERVLGMVRDNDGPADAAELAARIGLHVTTVRFHLDALCEEGAIARTRIKRPGVGRPRTGYVAVRDRLDYRTLAEVLVLELGSTAAERRRRAERAGRRWAGRIMADQTFEGAGPSGNPDRGVDTQARMIARVFDRMGFDPELDPAPDFPGDRRERTMRFYGCPVRDLAGDNPEVCALHLGLLRGLLGDRTDAEGGGAPCANLDPFVEPELCTASVVADG